MPDRITCKLVTNRMSDLRLTLAKMDGASPSQDKCLKNPQYCQRNVDMNYEHKLKKALNMHNINLVSEGYEHTGSWYFVSDSRRPPFMAK